MNKAKIINAYWQHRQAEQRIKPQEPGGYRVIVYHPSGKVEIKELGRRT